MRWNLRAAAFAPILVALLILCPSALEAQDLGARDARGIREPIERQLDAFRHDDRAAAFAIASPSIQRMFGTPEIFVEMVRRHYPEVYRAAKAEYAGLDLVAGKLIQRVWITDETGARALAYYEMVKGEEDSWRIAGVVLTRPDDRET